MEAGTGGLLVDKTRPSRIPPLGDAVTERVVALTLIAPPGDVTHWTAAAVARACAISVSSVHHTHQEFIRFLNAIQNQIPANKQAHGVLGNYATHKHPKVIE